MLPHDPYITAAMKAGADIAKKMIDDVWGRIDKRIEQSNEGKKKIITTKRAVMRELRMNLRRIENYKHSPEKLIASLKTTQLDKALLDDGFDFDKLQRKRIDESILEGIPWLQVYKGATTEKAFSLYGEAIESLKELVESGEDLTGYQIDRRIANIKTRGLMLLKHVDMT
jgi:hypothetical protein